MFTALVSRSRLLPPRVTEPPLIVVVPE